MGMDDKDRAIEIEFGVLAMFVAGAFIAVGERLMLPVQTGRHGVQRVSLPPLSDLRDVSS
jgi:hypothetical protein